MFTKTAIILLASLSQGKEILKRRHDESTPIIDKFPWSSFLNKTGLDPLQYLKPPSDDTPETLEPGPDRIACPVAIAAWSNFTDAEQHISIPGGQCLSTTEETCRTVACAPRGNVTVQSDEITGRMWNPVSTKCVFGGVGGIWQNDGSTLVIEMGYASQE
ncbi:uncharacterized protein FFB20_08193 [Fusarium fujikuroi]|uniref:Uncharacterized protein n=1 Tax=Gibberella fujikuroi (strain CBS 195.34 / IMI 58289 / NRRL A-6831) TaxID=1279085 RepID=S0DWL9_GIBF5|nr:uncharacterized protein FFUJ_13124 [Fusarium fujikuroi IMI 58289]KLP01650.1 uncharacterized protein Y057_500 [Fusarium fujikuroi]KLP11784.1 uncharacterized protein LW94_6068 [Fusarium fujikuroi]CCT66949.1 uncharacterized protein FFUJ_13124 [Fusarium fujikuroi IMI 58289]SCN88137.1 uncharacterized protein FFB20_08193 [Fusarium fujikuroi]SCN91657.1 uncharacterized protein FFC1_06504 [Fusarium fujikuroi]